MASTRAQSNASQCACTPWMASLNGDTAETTAEAMGGPKDDDAMGETPPVGAMGEPNDDAVGVTPADASGKPDE